MNYIKKIVIYCFAVLLCIKVSAQEALYPLNSNAAIKTYIQQHKSTGNENVSKRTTDITDSLPFIDDFSYEGVYPNPNLWSDKYVFINRDFPVDPPTIGVATFDGLNELGNPYVPTGTTGGYADHLTSQKINLKYPKTDTTIWLSFFYQPQGLGEQPDPTDSLLLEFNNPANDSLWNTVWQTAGGPLAPFKQAMINIRDTNYFTDSFRFRFTNIGNLNGNVDHWHIDYVRLKKDRNAADTAIADEGAFLYRNKSLLIPPYTSMPYSHYKTNPSAFTLTSETASYKNLTKSTIICSNDFRVVREDGTTIDYAKGDNTFNVNPFSTVQNTKSINYVFPSLSQPSLKYSIWNINTAPNAILANDSIKEIQILDNYYSYDDGTAEYAYGVNGKGAEVAYRFDLIKPDTLRGLDIYWNQFGPDVHNHLISLAVWSQISVGTGSDVLLYKYIDQKPKNIDSLNGFSRYKFEIAKPVSGTIYVGWIQDDEDILNVGFDKNTNTLSKIFFNAQGTWTATTISTPGSLMIRPLLGSALDVATGEIPEIDFKVMVYPNPVTDIINISVRGSHSSAFIYQLYDAVGRLVIEQKETTLNVSHIVNGFYLLKITDTTNRQSVTEKVFVRH